MAFRPLVTSVLSLGALAAMVVVPACGSASLCDNGVCGEGPDAEAGTTPDGSGPGGDGGGIVVPPGCDAAKDPKDQPECLNDAFAVFVSPAGADTAAGTKAAPVKTFAKALTLAQGGRSRVYACEGTFAENVVLDRSLSLYGGFVCATWAPGTGATVVAPPAGYALDLVKVTGVDVQDITFKAANGTAAAPSSIAVRVVGSKDVRFTRLQVQSGDGADGQKGADGAAGAYVTGDGRGLNAGDGSPGPLKTCTCTTGGTTTGGGGGAAAAAAGAGLPAIPENPAGANGAAGANAAVCTDGNGRYGANASAATSAAAAAKLGAVTDGNWKSSAGTQGIAGSPGQGGGGGGSNLANVGFGGGGGCGGCGGGPGAGGSGGGASLALFSVDSTLTVTSSAFSPTKGGAGGEGGKGAPGTAANAGGGTLSGCLGGNGGAGGQGAHASGGAGGVAAAILFQGTKPTVDSGSTLVAGEPGAGGTGGAAGENDGPNGKAGTLLDVATL